MFFNVFNRALVCAGIFALTACGGGDPADAPISTVHQSPHSVVQHPSPISTTPEAPAAAEGGTTRIAPVASVATAAEREAEQLRMVPYEQAFAFEIQRRAQERPEHLREPAEPVRAPGQAPCDPAAAQARPAECLPAQPGAPADAAGQAL
ncbi:hypothetical protein [Massilia pseudoviolaceinigra]|uniref:hypothetical protein n=1 Tax=Massilia pseudoviolaceinigra TaxID=3057165 RepID=UPI002796B1E8|nr:hypothetical protein [Massilia sp. CCM 9206]MDQ1919515.1 hypothetical protein [Massilia sp. CCM 9206]